MAADEKYDVVIIGAGHNGTSAAAYLAKCGLSVCVFEERPECGGAMEATEPMAGVRFLPHAIGNYAAPAPGWEQLELWKYGFRIGRSQMGDLSADVERGVAITYGVALISLKEQMGYAKLSGLLGQPPLLLRAERYSGWCLCTVLSITLHLIPGYRCPFWHCDARVVSIQSYTIDAGNY